MRDFLSSADWSGPEAVIAESRSAAARINCPLSSRLTALMTMEVCDHPVAQSGDCPVNAVAPLMNAMVTTIYSGTNEIQRNILATQVLRFPRA